MLHVPPYSCINPVASWGATRPAAGMGVSVTPGSGTYGSYAEIKGNLAADSFGLLICINNNTGGNATNRNTIVTIGVDRTGGTSYVDLIPDLICGGAAPYNAAVGGVWYYFPVFLPAGTAIAAKAAGSVTTAFTVGCHTFEGGTQSSMIPKVSRFEAIGMSGQAGTAFTPGTTSEGASWTSLGTLQRDCWYWQLGIQIATADTTWTGGTLNVDLAASDDGTNFRLLIADMPWTSTTGEAWSNQIWPFAYNYVKAGSEIYIRGQFSGVLDSYLGCAYGAG